MTFIQTRADEERGDDVQVLMTGATGAIGFPAAAAMVETGHRVTGVARDEAGAGALREVGVEPIPLDLFDSDAVSAAVRGHEAVAHLASSIPHGSSFTKRSAWATNDRIRSEGTALLVDAALAGGVERFVFASISLVYADGGTGWIDEDHPVAAVWEPLESALVAEAAVGRFTEAGRVGVSLRFGRLYGPGRASADTVRAVRARRMPIVGRGTNFVSSIHAGDAGTAVARALDAPGGIFNVVDDRPLPAARHATSLAETLGAPPPRHVPSWLASITVGGASRILTTSQRVSNRRFRETTGWRPAYPSVLEGWASLGAQADDR